MESTKIGINLLTLIWYLGTGRVNKNIAMAKPECQEFVKAQKTRMLFASERKVWIFPHLKVLRKELRGWYFDKENKPADVDDHMCENMGRLIIHDDLEWRKEYIGKAIPFRDEQIGSFDELNDEMQTIAANYY